MAIQPIPVSPSDEGNKSVVEDQGRFAIAKMLAER